MEVTWDVAWGVRILIKKQIIESVGKPRDEFIKSNQAVISTRVTVALYCQIMD